MKFKNKTKKTETIFKNEHNNLTQSLTFYKTQRTTKENKLNTYLTYYAEKFIIGAEKITLPVFQPNAERTIYIGKNKIHFWPRQQKVCDPAIKSQMDEAVGRKLKPISQKKLTEIIISKER